VAGGNCLPPPIFEFLRRTTGAVGAIPTNASTRIETADGDCRCGAKFPLVSAGAQCVQCLEMSRACTMHWVALAIMIETRIPHRRFFG
jgi:hypothetical protein